MESNLLFTILAPYCQAKPALDNSGYGLQCRTLIRLSLMSRKSDVSNLQKRFGIQLIVSKELKSFGWG